MQGKKYHQPKLFTTFQLADRMPLNNFWRRLKDKLDLRYLYKETREYYGLCGQKSIDPVVFFKLCLVGYLENIISDRKLIEHGSMRLDMIYFLDYDIDEELPWHSTISRTRQLFPEPVFESVFEHIFSMCVSKGMVGGTTQAIDSAPVKANASMDSLELKVPAEQLNTHLARVRHISLMDKATYRKAKVNKASVSQQAITASDQAIERVTSKHGRHMKGKRQSTVEPVFGTLTQFMGVRKVNTIGIKQANKVMLMAAMAYNIKKYLYFIQHRAQSMRQEASWAGLYFIDKIRLYLIGFKSPKLSMPIS